MNRNSGRREGSERGASLVMVAIGMLFILGMLGLGIDLASLYVGRTQAQRAADAAALAGAQEIVTAQFFAGAVDVGTVQSLAAGTAAAVGNQNLIAGINPNISSTPNADVTFDFTVKTNPKVTVVAYRDTAHNSPMPTFFMKIFGIQAIPVSAKATAEAYYSTPGGASIAPSCIKPWMYPNCDFGQPPQPMNPLANVNCADSTGTKYYPYLMYPPGSANAGQLVFPGTYSGLTTWCGGSGGTGGSIGECIQLKPGSPGDRLTPGQFMAVVLPPGGTSICPSCANNGGGSGGSGSSYGNMIACCYQYPIVSGQIIPVSVNTGNMTGPTGSGVDCLINENNSSMTGQDIISWCPNFPSFIPTTSTGYTIQGGASNPFAPGQQIDASASSSVVTVPIYDGHILNSGMSNNNVQILGFLQVFIAGENKNDQHTVYGYILNVAGDSGNGGSVINTGGGSPIPVRLIQQ